MNNWLKHDMEEAMREVNRLLLENPEITDDNELLSDMIEGSTGFQEVMERIMDAYQTNKEKLNGTIARINEIGSRMERYERNEKVYRSMMLTLMNSAQQKKVETVEATLSITKPRTSVNVLDVDALEQPFVKLVRQADKKAIASAIESGTVVEGAELVTGEPSLSIRTK